jgi:hypothetical protein
VKLSNRARTTKSCQGDLISSTFKIYGEINRNRRRFCGTAAVTIAAAQFGLVGSANAETDKAKSASPSSSKPGTNTSFGPLKQVNAGLLKKLDDMKDFDPEEMRKLHHLKVKVDVVCEAGGLEEDYGFVEGVGKAFLDSGPEPRPALGEAFVF